MPLPLIMIGAAAASGIIGLVKGGNATLKFFEAKELIDDAKCKFENKKSELESQRKKTSDYLINYGELKIKIWNKQFRDFVKLFRRIKNVQLNGNASVDTNLVSSISTESLAEMMQLSITAGQITKGGVASLGAGALAGIASYGGAMMFASASTGTAIASLSGVAATNATLAWFGGGSLASGGLGMAGGMMVLGGLVAGPILAVGGLLMAAKANANLAEAKAKYAETLVAIEKMENAITMLKGIESITKQYITLVNQLREILIDELKAFNAIVKHHARSKNRSMNFRIRKLILSLFGQKIKIEYSELSTHEKKQIHKTTQLIQLIKIILEKPLLDDEGLLNTDSERYILDTDFNRLIGGI